MAPTQMCRVRGRAGRRAVVTCGDSSGPGPKGELREPRAESRWPSAALADRERLLDELDRFALADEAMQAPETLVHEGPLPPVLHLDEGQDNRRLVRELAELVRDVPAQRLGNRAVRRLDNDERDARELR